jgi:hypothetical protein
MPYGLKLLSFVTNLPVPIKKLVDFLWTIVPHDLQIPLPSITTNSENKMKESDVCLHIYQFDLD